jgi:hypothetical protein
VVLELGCCARDQQLLIIKNHVVTKCYTGSQNWTNSLERHKQRKVFTEITLEDVGWIHLAQNRDWWRALVNMVMNLKVPYKLGNFLTEWLLAYQGLCSMRLVNWWNCVNRDSSVNIGTAAGRTTGVPFPAGAGTYRFAIACRPALGPTQPLIKWLMDTKGSFLGDRTARTWSRSPPSSVEVKNTWSYGVWLSTGTTSPSAPYKSGTAVKMRYLLFFMSHCHCQCKVGHMCSQCHVELTISCQRLTHLL